MEKFAQDVVNRPAYSVEHVDCGCGPKRQPVGGIIIPFPFMKVSKDTQLLTLPIDGDLLVSFAQVQCPTSPAQVHGRRVNGPAHNLR